MSEPQFRMKVEVTGSTKREAWENLLIVVSEACTSKQDRNGGEWSDWIEMNEGRIEAKKISDGPVKVYFKNQVTCPAMVVSAADFDVLVVEKAKQKRKAEADLRIATAKLDEMGALLEAVRKERDDSHERADTFAGLLEEIVDHMPDIPDKNCSCHISPPCHDCVDFGGIRELIESVNTAVSKWKGGRS